MASKCCSHPVPLRLVYSALAAEWHVPKHRNTRVPHHTLSTEDNAGVGAKIDRVAWHAAGGGANGIGVATIHESAIWGMETLLTAVSRAAGQS